MKNCFLFCYKGFKFYDYNGGETSNKVIRLKSEGGKVKI